MFFIQARKNHVYPLSIKRRRYYNCVFANFTSRDICTFCQVCRSKHVCKHKREGKTNLSTLRETSNYQSPLGLYFAWWSIVSLFDFAKSIILIHFLVSHHWSSVFAFQILTDLMRSKPNDILATPRHLRRPEPVVEELLPAALALLLDHIVVLVLEVSQVRPAAVAHGDSEFSLVYTLLSPVTWPAPGFSPTHKLKCHLSSTPLHTSWDLQLQWGLLQNLPPLQFAADERGHTDTAVTAISAALTHSELTAT